MSRQRLHTGVDVVRSIPRGGASCDEYVAAHRTERRNVSGGPVMVHSYIVKRGGRDRRREM